VKNVAEALEGAAGSGPTGVDVSVSAMFGLFARRLEKVYSSNHVI
jgi:hypothetical protein